MAIQPGQLVSFYKIVEKLGEGGMGIVYKAEDTKLQRTVALKFLPRQLVISDEEKTRFLYEAQAASALNHPNIMTIHGIEEVEDSTTGEKETFIVMEYVEGETLKEKLKKRSLKIKELLDIAISITDGLNAAHEKEIIHRDIKSDNIMISTKGFVKIMDFGLAKRKGMLDVTRLGTTPGTLAYMSPEQSEGLEIDHRSDLFSSGVVMYEMATGRLPFQGEHEAAILYSIVNELPQPVTSLNPNIPKEFERIIHKALEKEASERYQHADDLLADLKKLKKDMDSKRTTVTMTHVPVPREPEKKAKWRRPGVILVSVFALILLLIGLVEIFNRDTSAVFPEGNSLAVLYFENLKDPDDPERLGQIIQELVIADLSEISSLKVMSSQRLFDLQKQLGSKDRKKINRELASEIAKQAGAQTMLTGNLFQTENKMILTSQLVSVQEGTVIESQRVEGNDIYNMVDNLAVQIHEDLSLPSSPEDRVDVAVIEKTTSSVDAYQLYLEGVDLFNDSKFDSAVVRFQKVVSIDPTFHHAYYKMAMAQWWSESLTGEGTSEQALETLAHCLSSDSYATTKDKFMAEGAIALINQRWNDALEIYQKLVEFVPDEKEAWYGVGEAYFHGAQDYPRAVEAFEKVIKMDPEFTLAYRHIFDVYNDTELFDHGFNRAVQLVALNPDKAWSHFYLGNMLRGKEEDLEALDAYERAVELDPEHVSAYRGIFEIYREKEIFDQGISRAMQLVSRYPEQIWPYGFLAFMYREKGEFDSAITAYQNALNTDPKAYQIISNIGYMYHLQGRYDKAVQTYSLLTEPEVPPNWQSLGKVLLSFVYGEQGQYRRAIKIMEERLILAKSTGIDDEANSYLHLARFSHFLGDSTTAFAHVKKALVLNPGKINILFAYWVEGMVRASWKQEEELATVIDTVRSIVEREGITGQIRVFYSALLYENSILQGKIDKALNEFEELEDFKTVQDVYLYKQALLYLEKAEYEEALATTEKMQSFTVSRDAYSYIYPRSFYVRGLIYEEMGDLLRARENYERLLSLWQYGDEEILEKQDASRRLGRLIRLMG